MRLASTTHGFGRVEDDAFVPMGEDLVRSLATGESADERAVPLGDVTLVAPIPRPSKIVCVGPNYRDHAEEAGQPIDGYLPLGPWLVTPDEVGDPQRLAVDCTIDDEVVQDPNTGQMIFGVAALIAFVSGTITLQPGDVLVTGTPPGVGMARTPQRWLRDGQRMTVGIERIGRLTATVRMRGGRS